MVPGFISIMPVFTGENFAPEISLILVETPQCTQQCLNLPCLNSGTFQMWGEWENHCTTEAPAHTQREENQTHQHRSQTRKGKFQLPQLLQNSAFHWDNLEKGDTEQQEITALQLQRTLSPFLNPELWGFPYGSLQYVSDPFSWHQYQKEIRNNS